MHEILKAVAELAAMLDKTGGWGVAALAIVALIFQRRDYLRLQRDLFGLAQTVATTSAKSEAAVNGLRDMLLHRWQ